LCQDSRGFLWIATLEGLSRFDGKNFKNFYALKNDSIVNSNYFGNVYEYKRGHLVLNNGPKIICFNTITETFYKIFVSGLIDIVLKKSAQGDVYFIEACNKAYVLNNNLEITDSIAKPPNEPTGQTLYVNYFLNDILLIKYGHTFYFYTTRTKDYEVIPVHFSLPGKGINCTFRYFDPINKQLYFGDYYNGLYRYSLKTRKTEHLNREADNQLFVKSNIQQIVPMQNNELWFLTTDGIGVWNTRSNTMSAILSSNSKSNSLVYNITLTAYTDKDNNFWIGTANGLSKLNANTLNIKSWHDGFVTSLNNGLMSVVKGGDENMYASVYGAKAYQLNSATNKITVLRHPLNGDNWSLFAKGDEIIRTGGGNRLLSYNTKTKKFKVLDYLKPYYPGIEIITLGFLHSNGDEWYCANKGGGFLRKLANSDHFKTYKNDDGINHFTNGYYSCYTEDDNGDLWFGVNKSSRLLHWNSKTDRFNEINFSNTKGTENIILPGINDITHDTAGNIWVASDGGGLIKYAPDNKTASHYSITDGLPASHISALRFDNKNRLWLGTINGLSCFVISENRFENFNKENGLPDDFFDNYCRYFDTKKNLLWFGTNTTLMSFNPEDLLSRNVQRFPVYIDEIIVNGKRLSDTLQNHLSLKSFENNLLFHFTAIDFNKGKNIEYSYKLEGADKNWNFNGTNQSASYANIKPGKYIFKVRAKYKGENQWIETKEPLEFNLAVPWNRSWWFILLMIGLSGSLGWFIIRTYYLRRLEKQAAIIEKQMAISEERSRIAADMHDDMGAGLSRIRYLSTSMKNEIQDEKLKHNFDTLISSSDGLVDKMNDIIWTLNKGDESLEEVIYYIRSQCSEMLDNAGISFEYALPERIPDLIISSQIKRNLYLAIKEAVHNVIKHAHATQVNLLIQISQNITIKISDNGKGFKTEELTRTGNGLNNYQKRMTTLRGKVQFHSDETGTAVCFEVPLF
jgi:signal transduction histidine kinase